MGQIAACNVTNDLFAMNAPQVLNYCSFLGLPKDIPKELVVKMLQGQIDFLKPLGTTIQRGHTIFNPWPLLGGSASAIVQKQHMKEKTGARPGDHIFLTKPLGIQPIMAAYRLLTQDISLLSDFEIPKLLKHIDIGIKCMTTSNHGVTRTIHDGKFFDVIHAMTDVTGFGFKTHLKEMLETTPFGAKISYLPVIPSTIALSDTLGYPLEMGTTAETAGPMMILVDAASSTNFGKALSDHKVWWRDVGTITKELHEIVFNPDFKLIEIDDY
jgi:selenide,water dikinase